MQYLTFEYKGEKLSTEAPFKEVEGVQVADIGYGICGLHHRINWEDKFQCVQAVTPFEGLAMADMKSGRKFTCGMTVDVSKKRQACWLIEDGKPVAQLRWKKLKKFYPSGSRGPWVNYNTYQGDGDDDRMGCR